MLQSMGSHRVGHDLANEEQKSLKRVKSYSVQRNPPLEPSMYSG